MSQISFFDGIQPLKITKPIRLIECFAGYGSQALALKYLGVEFEHWKIAEWSVKSIQAYKDMHFADDNTDYSEGKSKEWLIDYLFARGISADYNKPMTREQISRMGESKIRTVYNNIISTHNLVSVCNVNGEDLKITDTDKYTYILTYSFPCQDLSQAGLSKGMQKGSGTRSGLLWEIERMLDECDELPQILLMENVPQVIGEKNRDAFRDWFCKLESLGYKSWYAIMNGKDYEIPQNRDRCFMVSALGDHYYEFPNPKPLKLRLKDLLEDEVDEKYYLSDKTIEMFIKHTEKKQAQGCGFKFEPTDGNGVGKCISTRAGARTDDNFIKEYSIIKPAHEYFGGSVENTDIISTIDTGVGNWHTLVGEAKCEQVGQLQGSGYNEMTGRVYGSNGLSPTVRTFCGGGQEIEIVEGKTKMFQYPRGENKGGILEVDACPTITTCSWENNCMLVEDDVRVFDYYNKSEKSGLVCGTITTNQAIGSCGVFEVQQTNNSRIRKLTPKECFRLMGVKDVDFERVSKNQSDSSLYHLAGDSIITNCLMAIFEQML
jgi:DNA (cytosine-5)-methyltransferase 1